MAKQNISGASMPNVAAEVAAAQAKIAAGTVRSQAKPSGPQPKALPITPAARDDARKS